VAVGHLLRATGRLLAHCGLQACGLFLLVEMLVGVLAGVIAHITRNYILFTSALIFMHSIALGSCLFWFGQHAAGARPGIGESLAEALRNCVSAALTLVLYVLLFPGVLQWTLIAVAPENRDGPLGVLGLAVIALDFYVLTRLSLAVALVDRQTGVLGAVRQSWRLTKGRAFRTFVLVMVPGIGVLVLLRLTGPLMNAVSNWLLVRAAGNCLLALPGVPLIALVVCYCLALQARAEDQ
jgi:hypothetical protein